MSNNGHSGQVQPDPATAGREEGSPGLGDGLPGGSSRGDGPLGGSSRGDGRLGDRPRGPVDSSRIPRYAGPATFARLPRLDEVGTADVAVVGVPFDSGVSYRPGARFGGNAIREASRLLRPYNPAQDASPFALAQVADAGDIAANPFHIGEAVDTVEAAADELLGTGARLMTLGGDHTIALPLLRSVAKKHGPVALLHFDAHLDTWDTYFGAAYTHGTPFRRAVEEGILDTEALSHVGTRGPLYGKSDLDDDARMGFGIVTSADVMRRGVDEIVDQLRQRVGDRPLYISVDIDVLDPAHAPGTGTPEAGGLTSRELLEIIRGLASCHLVSADVVEVAPAYDHAEITSVAASHTAYELTTIMSRQTAEARTAAESAAPTAAGALNGAAK
ncbi:agmatinase [Streptomyces sp. NPDC059396]|uniref:agmatinase n=1 Tax=Streptomyces sp. NPDC059396 TaxID=3346819 RepID=UPI0036C6F287